MTTYYRLNRKNIFLFFSVICTLHSVKLSACDCGAFPPLTTALFNSQNPKQIVFKGKVMSVGGCKDLGSCVFQVDELYFGSTTKNIEALYDCSTSCMMNFSVGEEWIVYGEYVQVDKIKIEFCSRSRKLLASAFAEVDQIAYGLSAKDEMIWLVKNLGVKELKAENPTKALGHKNEQPNSNTKIILVAISIAAMAMFILLIKRFLK